MPTRAEWRDIIRSRWPYLWRGVVAIAIIAGIVAAWEVYSLEDYTDVRALLALGASLRSESWAIPATIALFIGAGITFLPLTVMVVATIILFGAVEGFWIALAGTVATAIVGYALGSVLGAKPLRRLGGATLKRLDAQAGAHGITLIAALRILPVAHFHAVSLLAGASSIGPMRYLWGTLLGTVPGLIVIAAVSNQARRFLLDPNAFGLVVLAGIGLLSLVLFHYLRRWMRRVSRLESEEPP